MTATLAGVGTRSASLSASSISPALPAGMAAGDLMVASVLVCNNSTISTPSGWTKLQQTNSGGSFTSAVYWRMWQSGDAAPTFTWSPSDINAAQILRITGALAGTPIGAVGTVATGTTSPHGSTGIASTAYTSLVVLIDTASNTTALTNPTGWTAQAGGTGSLSAHTFASKLLGATGSSSGSTSSSGAVAAWTQQQIEIKGNANPGTLAATDATDTAAGAGVVAWRTALAATETADTAALVGSVASSGVLAAVEGVDRAAITDVAAGDPIPAALAVTEFSDAVRVTGVTGASVAFARVFSRPASVPSYIAANLVREAQNAVATLEAIYNANTVDPDKAGAVTVAVATAPAVSSTTPAITSDVTGLYAGFIALYNAIPLLISDVTGVDPSIGSGLLTLARGLGQAMDPGDAVAAFALAADTSATPPSPLPAWTANRVIDNANLIAISRLSRAVFLAPYVEGLVAQTYRTRADAVTAKADCVTRFDRELDLCGMADDIAFAGSLSAMRDAAVDYLAQVIINAKPVLQVTTPIYIPALLAAWQLYEDPLRADELIARNDVKTSEFMPTTFEAQAP